MTIVLRIKFRVNLLLGTVDLFTFDRRIPVDGAFLTYLRDHLVRPVLVYALSRFKVALSPAQINIMLKDAPATFPADPSRQPHVLINERGIYLALE